MAVSYQKLKTKKLTDDSNNEALVPSTRILSARKLLIHTEFSERSVRVAKRVARLFMANDGVSPSDRRLAANLLEFLIAGRVEPGDSEDEPIAQPKPTSTVPLAQIDGGLKSLEDCERVVAGIGTFEWEDPGNLFEGGHGTDQMTLLHRIAGVQVYRDFWKPHVRGEDVTFEMVAAKIVEWCNAEAKQNPDATEPLYRLNHRFLIQPTEYGKEHLAYLKSVFNEEI